MANPSEMLREQGAVGRKILTELIMTRRSKKSVDRDVTLGVGVLNAFFDLSGHKKMITDVGRTLGHSSADGYVQCLEAQADSWAADSKNLLRKLSVLRLDSKMMPNSDRLLSSFNSQLRYVKPETRLSRGISYLEELADRNVILNDEIGELAKAIVTIEKSTPSVPEDIEAGLDELVKLLQSFPAEAEAVKGAICAYNSRGPDWGRQTIYSMRNALENLVRRMSGEANWREGLRKIVPSESLRKPIDDTYNLLSAKGVHGPVIPAEEDVAFCIGLTQMAMKYLIDCRKIQGRS